MSSTALISEFNLTLSELLSVLEILSSNEETKAYIDRTKRRILVAKQISGDDYIIENSYTNIIFYRDVIMKGRSAFFEFCQTYISPKGKDTSEDLDIILLMRNELLDNLTDNEKETLYKLMKKLLKHSIKFALSKR